jgi:hypothetical protein
VTSNFVRQKQIRHPAGPPGFPTTRSRATAAVASATDRMARGHPSGPPPAVTSAPREGGQDGAVGANPCRSRFRSASAPRCGCDRGWAHRPFRAAPAVPGDRIQSG